MTDYKIRIRTETKVKGHALTQPQPTRIPDETLRRRILQEYEKHTKAMSQCALTKTEYDRLQRKLGRRVMETR